MSKTIVTVAITKEMKEDFARYAEEMGTNMSNLLSMFIASSLKRRDLTFYASPFEIVEPTKEEAEIIAKYEKERDEWTLESVSAEEVYKLIWYKSKYV